MEDNYYDWKLSDAKNKEITALRTFVKVLNDHLLSSSTLSIRAIQRTIDDYINAKQNRGNIEQEMQRVYIEQDEGPRSKELEKRNLQIADNLILYETFKEAPSEAALHEWLNHSLQPYLEDTQEEISSIYTIYNNSKIILPTE